MQQNPLHYFQTSTSRCERCSDKPLELLAGLLGGIGVFILGLLCTLCWLRTKRPAVLNVLAKRAVEIYQQSNSARPGLKICVGFYQIISTIGDVYNVNFPPAYRNVINVFKLLTFKLTALLPSLPLQCAFPSLRNQLLFVNLVPLGVVAAAATAGSFTVLWTRPHQSVTAVSLIVPSLPFLLVWAFIVLPPVSSLGLCGIVFEYSPSHQHHLLHLYPATTTIDTT